MGKAGSFRSGGLQLPIVRRLQAAAPAMLALLFAPFLIAVHPVSSYIFPAGGQAGTETTARVGGLFFHGEVAFRILGEGIQAFPKATPMETLYFQGPLIYQPDSQKAEDYPLDHLATLQISKDAIPGIRYWTCLNDQGITVPMKFEVGIYPEVVEEETEGTPSPVKLANLPVTANGRIHPRQDLDIWEFVAREGEWFTCSLFSAKLGYPLQAVLEIFGPDGNFVPAHSRLFSGDPVITFQALASGPFQARIRDALDHGGQDYVYRLALEKGQGTTPTAQASLPKPGKLSLPSDVRGCIIEPGQTDTWSIELPAKSTCLAEIQAGSQGSPLDSFLEVLGPDGKMLVSNDDAEKGNPDSALTFTTKQEGIHQILVNDNYPSRGGPEFLYQLKLTQVPSEGFRLTLGSPVHNTEAKAPPPEGEKYKRTRGTGVELNLEVFGKYKNKIELRAEGLPEGVTLSETSLQARAKKFELYFDALPDVPSQAAEVTLFGTLIADDGTKIEERAHIQVPPSYPQTDKLQLFIAPFVPFRHSGLYSLINDVPAGSTLVKHYTLERFGYDGPITVRLGERQGRTLQGVTGPVLQLPAGATEFDYRVQYPAEMELGRTARLQLQLEARIPDANGVPRMRSYTSFERNDQMITIASNGRLALRADPPNLRLPQGASKEITFHLQRGHNLENRPLRIELIPPRHLANAFSCKPATLNPGHSSATLRITRSNSTPCNAPLVFRASTDDPDPDRYLAEVPVEIVE
jgi:hypothetical protein